MVNAWVYVTKTFIRGDMFLLTCKIGSATVIGKCLGSDDLSRGLDLCIHTVAFHYTVILMKKLISSVDNLKFLCR